MTSVIWKGEYLFCGVYCPAKNDLFCDPGGVAFAELFKRDGFLSCYVVLVIWAEEFIDGVEEMPCHLLSFFCPPLGYTNKIIEVYLDVC